jgi:hypothetical protein
MRFCCREITIDGTDLRVYPSGSIWRFHQQQKKWTHVKGSITNIYGHLTIRISKKDYLIHRIVAHAYFGFDLSSPLMIDHRDRNTMNNGVWNLRIVNSQENQWNRGGKGIKKLNTTWKAKIRLNNKDIYKNFKTEEEALEWRKEMKTLLHNITEPDYKHIMTQCLRNI